ncbi:MAG: FecR domain-containing protein [Proteobacteria bacterium]|nr:FecR domain-containing protein [Pseudomonadota bacterium]HQR04159.1 FecR domain-containing protein [Rhodocyclaceae bacterium]
METSAPFLFRCLAGLSIWIALAWMSLAVAAPPAMVDQVQAPAWLERGGGIRPLAPGDPVVAGDAVRTGPGGRVYLALAEGSLVRLGASAHMDFPRIEATPSLFRGVFEVAAGAFRFTTGLVSKARPREVAIRVGTATVGIRGTDVWGKRDAAGDFVVLIEGHIEMTPVTGQPFAMARPMEAYSAPVAGNPALVPVTAEELQRRAQETDVVPGVPTLIRNGPWALGFGEFGTEAEALAAYDKVQHAGYPARLRIGGDALARRYTLVLPGFASEADARAVAGALKGITGLEGVPLRAAAAR